MDIKSTILSQYANSPILLRLLEDMDSAIDQAGNIDEFYRLVWDVQTAEGYGLDVWGRIVNVHRTFSLPQTYPTFGFDEADEQPFNQAPFYSGVESRENLTLTDDIYRALILVKAYSNVTQCNVPSLNYLMSAIFYPNRAYVQDTGGMTMRIVLDFYAEPWALAIIKQSGAFPHPTGVEFDVISGDPTTTFGFAEASAHAGFNTGVFFGGFL